MDYKNILEVSSNDEGLYQIRIGEGNSVEEVAFAISVIIKCFNRDEVIAKEDMLKLIDKYLNDVQYEEVIN